MNVEKLIIELDSYDDNTNILFKNEDRFFELEDEILKVIANNIINNLKPKTYHDIYHKLNITDDVLDKLGFSEYWDEHCTWGGRTLTFTNGTRFRIIEQEQMDDGNEGYGTPQYISQHFYFTGWFALPKNEAPHCDLFFLHEMQEVITIYYPDCLEEFKEKCKKAHMEIYLV